MKNSGKIKNRARRCSKNRFFRYNGHFLNLAPRFRAIEPPVRPGLNLRLVVRLNHPICHQNEPKNVHYLPVVTPRVILRDTPNNDCPGFGTLRAVLRAPTAPPRCGRGVNRHLVIWGYAGIYAVYGYFRPGGYSVTPSRPPDNHCLGVSDFPAAGKVLEIVHTPPGARPGS